MTSTHLNQLNQSDIAELEQKYLAAKSAVDSITHRGGYPVYPEPIKQFFLHYLTRWQNTSYNPKESGERIKQIESASLIDLCSILTLFMRSERFSDGAWIEILKSDNIERVIARAKTLLD